MGGKRRKIEDWERDEEWKNRKRKRGRGEYSIR